ncbi:MAG TPA: hypothetical protein VM695_01090 [Phycisphaerae bacterium]|nr:hypothetical protein [Phycisphaerae bacterium]
MRPRDRAIEILSALPADATIDEIVHELHVRLKVEKGREQLDAGQGIAHEEMMKQVGLAGPEASSCQHNPPGS